MKALFSRRGSRSSHTNGGGGSSSSSGGRFKGRRTTTTADGDDGNLYYTPPAPAAQTSADSDAGIGSVPPPVKSSSSSRLSRATSLGTISGLVAAASPTARKSTPPDFQRQLSAYSGTTDSNHDTRSTAAPSIRSSRSTSTNALSIGKSASRRLSTWTADAIAKRKQSRSHPPSSYHFDDENTTTTTLKTKRKDASDGSRSNTNTHEDLHPAVFVVSNPSVSVSPPTPRPRATSTMSSTHNDDSFTTPGDTQDGGSATNATTNTMQSSSNEPDTTDTAGTTYVRTTADTWNRTLDVPGNGPTSSSPNHSGLSKKSSTRSRKSRKDVSFEPAAAAPKATLAVPLSPSTLAKQLEELAVSHGDGLLSDSEYRTLRQRLLERSVEANPSVDSAIESPGTLHFNNRLSVLDLEDKEAAQRDAAQEQNMQPPSPSRTSRTLPSMFKRASILGKPKVQRGSSAASTSGPPSSWSLRRSTSRLSINSAFSAASRNPGPLTDSQVPNGAVAAAAAPTLAPSNASAMSSSSSTPRSLKPGAVQRMLSTRSAASSTRSISDDDRNGGGATSSFGFGSGSGAGTGSGGGTTTGDRASSLAASSSRPSRRRLMSVASFQTTTSSERKAAEASNLERDVHSMRQARSLATSPAAKGLARARSRSLMQERERERESNNSRRGSLEVERSGSRSRASSLRRSSQHQQQGSSESAPARVGEESSTSTTSAAALGFDDLDWQYSDKTAKEIQAEINIVEAEGKRVAAAFSDNGNGETNGGKGAADEAGRDAVAQRYEERLAFLRSKLRSAKIRESFAK